MVIIDTNAGMVVVHNGYHCIRIPGVAHLLPTPIPNHFSIEHGQLHYIAQEGDELLTKKA